VKTREAVLTAHIRYLLHTNGYTGPRCTKEFGVGLSWFSDFMRGAHSPRPELMELVFEHINGFPLLSKDVPTLSPLVSLRKGACRNKEGAEVE